MTITNHVLAGAIIGLTVKNPAAAIVLALASHFVLDALPHFGYVGNKGYGEAMKHRLSYIVAIAMLCTTIAVAVVLVVYGRWFALLTGAIAASPDAIGVYNYLVYEKHGKRAGGMVRLVHVQFHRVIQWCERPWGVITEALVFLGLGALLIKIL
ncbi:MAG TPA: hypothetical protein VLF69_03090 [Candidatus Saccharimonadales bacterium]|nr:hypothetical protein [Candidatus Saccharimonadales bacterium]